MSIESQKEKVSLPGSGPPDIRRFGNYFLIRKLAEGGMAEIFLAKQVGAEGFERNVVIKRMLPHLSAMGDFVGMFLDEARLAARLTHHNIVQINDLGMADGCYFICMEYLPGEDFSTVLRTASKQGRYLPMPVVSKVVADAARGLHYAHEFSDEAGRSLNIVHRDVSPSNIYVTYQGQVKVLDFGIARAESRVTQTTAGVVKGKYMYMSPEQARGEVVDRRSDVFALGVSLYEALTHIRPFARENDLAILNSVLKNEFLPPRHHRPEIPLLLEGIILKAMAANREDRFATASDLAAAIDEYVMSAPDSGSVHQLPALMKEIFGESRVQERTRVPTLSTFVQNGVQVPGRATPGDGSLERTEASSDPLASTKSTVMPSLPPTPAAAESKPKKSKTGLVAMALLFLASAAVFAWRAMSEKTPVTPPVAVATPVPVPPPSVPPPAVPTPTAVPLAVEAPVADVPPQVQAKAPVADAKPKRRPVQLEAVDVERVVAKNRGTIMGCFELHKNALTKDEGLTHVRFTILGSGKVDAATVTGDLEGTPVAGCLEKRVASLKFPQHRDKELTLSLPLKYQVGR